MRVFLVAAACVLCSVPAVAQDSPFGVGWGAGMGTTANNIGEDIVNPGDAIIDADGRVRVLKTSNFMPRVIVESHYTWRLGGVGGEVGIGPAMFVQAAGGSTQGLFDAAGAGVLIELGPQGNTSFNLILGGLVDFAVSRLHPDYIDGRRSPTDELLFVEGAELSAFMGFVIGIK